MTDRKAIKSLFGGHCAYCGEELGDSFEIDHIVPIRRGCDVPYAGVDSAENCYPACRSCNRSKKCYGLEVWRKVIAGKLNELNRDSAAYRTAKRYGLVQETGAVVVFYFERFIFNSPQ